MSTFTQLTVLALASAVLASPPAYGYQKHGHGHKHLHGTGASSGFYPYPTANGTGLWGSTGINKSTGYGTSTQVATTFQTETSYQTVTVEEKYAQSSAVQSAPIYGNSAAPSAPTAEADSCAVVTVTNTEKVTLTVTEGQQARSSSAPAYSVPSSSQASPETPSSAPASSAPAYSAPASSIKSEASGAKSSANSAPAYSASAESSSQAAPISSSAAPILSQYANKGVAAKSASATASAPASYSSASSSAGGKRGLAYNDASLASCFSGADHITWAYNWGSSKGDLEGNYNFIPTLWGTGSDFTGSWSENAKSAISAGSTHLFSFNEPDHTAQANLGPAAAATAYAQYMNPFKGQAKLCAPSVTNGGGDMGLTWLKSFLDACTDCQIDCLNIHWYDSAGKTDYFKSHIQDAIKLANGKPVYVSEFGATGSDDQIDSFLQEVMPWMDSNNDVAGYAYFMVKDGLLVSGTEPSTYGSTYKTFSS